jgi:hypothetical protein
MRIIKIEESKVDKLSNHIEESLKHLGKAMSCVETLMEGGYGERDDDDDDDEMEGMRGGYRGGGYGMRDYDGYGMRRRSSRTGRYMR